MDPFTRRLTEEAERIDAAARDRYDRFERKWAEREARQPREVVQREMLYRTQENARVSPPVHQVPAVRGLSAEEQHRWDAWLDNRVDKHVDALCADIDKAVEKILRKTETTFARLDEKINQLQKTNDTLRDDLAAQAKLIDEIRSDRGTKSRALIVHPNAIRNRDAAA